VVQNYDGAAWDTVLAFRRQGGTTYTQVWNPTNDAMEQIATTKAKTTVSIGAFFEGAVSTSAKQIRWVVPYNAETVTLDRGKFVYGGGSPSGTTTIKIEQFDVSGVSQASDTMDILASHSVNTVNTDSGISFTLSGNDYLEITCTAAGAHEDLSVWFQGTQEIIT
jgi:hypothetical protein